VAQALHFCDPLTREEYYRSQCICGAFFVDKSLFLVEIRLPKGLLSRVDDEQVFLVGRHISGEKLSIICELNNMPDLSSTSAGESGIKFGSIVFIGDLRTLGMGSVFIHFTKKYTHALKLASRTMLQVALGTTQV